MMKMKNVKNAIEQLSSTAREYSADDVLGLIGLERRRYATDMILPALGLFGLGLAVGASLGLTLAPRSGRQFRAQLGQKASDLREKITSTATQIAGEKAESIGAGGHASTDGTRTAGSHGYSSLRR